MIHCFTFDDTRIVMDVPSGAVHVVDDLAWEIIQSMNNKESVKNLDGYSTEAINEAAREVDKLVREGLLFSSSADFQTYSPPSQPIVKSLCLHIAHDCNLKCTYCFAGKGSFGGQQALMSLEVGKKALDFLLVHSGHRKHCEVDFFGGEPLMNFQVVRELVHYGREKAKAAGKEIKFTLTTNAVLLSEEIQKFLNEQEISVVLSLDGRPGVHDAMRPFSGGAGSYEVVMPKIREFIKSRNNQNYYVRGTYTAGNKDFAADVLHMADLGFKELSVEPVVARSEDEYALTDEDLPYLREEYNNLTKAFLARLEEKEHAFNFFHFNLDLFKGPCLPKRLSGCGAGHEYLAVTPEGELYPCHQFVGRAEYQIGNVNEGILKPALMKTFQQAHVENKEVCRRCWAKYLCSGGCHANAEGAHGSIYEPYELGCELEKKRLECAIYIQVKKAGLA